MRLVLILFLFVISATVYSQQQLSLEGLTLKEELKHIQEVIPNAFKNANPVKRLDSIVDTYVGDFNGIAKTTYSYDSEHNVEMELNYYKQDTTSQYSLVDSLTWAYDTDNNVVDYQSFRGWDVFSNEFTTTLRVQNVYNNNQLIEQVHSAYSYMTQQWEEEDRYLYTYNTNGEITELIFQEFVNGQWENNYKSVYHYNNNDLFYLWERFQYINGGLDTVSMADLAYDSNDRLILNIFSLYYPGYWLKVTKDEYEYPAVGQEVHKMSTFGNNVWTYDNKTETSFDQVNNLTFRTYSLWNVNSQSWDTSVEYEYNYDNNFPYAVLATNLKERDCQHELVTSTVDTYINGQLRLHHDLIYYWSNLMTSLTNLDIQSDLHVFPNPASDILSFDLPDSNKPSSIELFNATGKRIISTQLSDNRLTVSDLPSGFYSFLIKQSNKAYSGKVMINR